MPDEHNENITLRLFDGSIFGDRAGQPQHSHHQLLIYDLNVEPQESAGVEDAAARRDDLPGAAGE